MSDPEDWSAQKVHMRVIEIRAAQALNPPAPGTEISAFREKIMDLPPEWQGLSFECFTTGLSIGANVNATEKMKFKRDSYFSGGGFVLILVGALLTFLRNNMSAEQSMASTAMISAGIATFLVFLPGFLKLQGAMAPNGAFESMEFKGGGAIAIFVLTFILFHFVLKL